eukprot:10506014-Alexandrium_andersonii.AAC.1
MPGAIVQHVPDSRVRKFESMSKEQLVVVATRTTGKVESLQKRLKVVQRARTRANAVVQKLKAELALAKSGGPDADFRLARIHTRFTVRGTCAVGLRRNMGNTAAADMGRMLLDDMSGQTVCRSECATGAALVASARNFHEHIVR